MNDSGFELCDLLDRLLAAGVVIQGQILISVAGVELIYLDLRLLLSSVETAMRPAIDPPTGVSHAPA